MSAHSVSAHAHAHHMAHHPPHSTKKVYSRSSTTTHNTGGKAAGEQKETFGWALKDACRAALFYFWCICILDTAPSAHCAWHCTSGAYAVPRAYLILVGADVRGNGIDVAMCYVGLLCVDVC